MLTLKVLNVNPYSFYIAHKFIFAMIAKVKKIDGKEFQLVKSFEEKERAEKYAANRRKEGKRARLFLVTDNWRVYLNA